MALAKRFLKNKGKLGLERNRLTKINERSRLMKAIMVDDIDTDDSMKDLKFDDIKSTGDEKVEKLDQEK